MWITEADPFMATIRVVHSSAVRILKDDALVFQFLS